MSKIICSAAIDGAIKWVARAEKKLAETIAQKGENAKVFFPDTAYYLPIIYSFTGQKIETLSDCRKALLTAKELLPSRPSEHVWLPYLGNALDAGIAALFACEIIEACKYLIGPPPVDGIWIGAANDIIMRERGVEFVDGTAPGFAAIVGVAPNNEIAVKIARELQQKNLYVFMAGATKGRQFAEQLAEEGVQLGWETRLVPFGKDVSAMVYALGFANRAALSFGGVKPGDAVANLRYNKNRIMAFVLAFDEVDEEKYAIAAGALNYGFPIIADTNIPQILPSGICTYEHVVSSVPYDKIVDRALEVRGCKVKINKVPIPVPYGPAFEGERIRKHDVHVEFGGNITTAFEFVTMVGMDEIEDGVIEIIGTDIDEVEVGSALPLGIWVEVAGRKMQPDFEAVLERQIHHLLNCAEGIWHMGQRDIVWTRISKSGFAKGLRLRHYGDIIHAQFHSNYPAIVDKVKVTLITDKDEVQRRVEIARRVYRERNQRLASLTDESVDTFYSCLLCQSFAPNHVCIITPERLGLCGAYNWLDGKAAYEIDETGPNQPVKKGTIIDPIRGIFSGVNEYVYSNSHKKVKSFSIYSIMHNPMTSCGCFEVILAYIPECNGIMAVNREYTGNTPVGMTFSTLAGNVGGGAQTPGFMGCGKVYLTSKKFIAAEGGHKRLVWMTTDLKRDLGDDMKKLFETIGLNGLFEKIADETISTDPIEIRKFLEKKEHPAITMDDMAFYAEEAKSEENATEEKKIEEKKVEEKKLETPQQEANQIQQLTDLSKLKNELILEIRKELKEQITKEIVSEIICVLEEKFLGKTPALRTTRIDEKIEIKHDDNKISKSSIKPSTRISFIKSFPLPKEAYGVEVHRVKIGATKKEGGTRDISYEVGGSNTMPFHHWEGTMQNRPLVAMEVFDRVSEKFPNVLKEVWGEVLYDPVRMAKMCVEKYGADLISIRLDSTHPERGDVMPEDSLTLVKSILSAVGVPLIITGHNHYEKMNAVMKEIAAGCAGENLLLNWAEPDNYRAIGGAALAYGHTVVAQSPIDVNIAKQLNILLTGMDVPIQRIIIDPLTGAMGYGIEYTYSVMERIRLTGLGGDLMLLSPMIVSPGHECARIKELKASESEFPSWGDVKKRAVFWELATATALLYAGADILIMYHPEAAMALKRTILQLMEN